MIWLWLSVLRMGERWRFDICMIVSLGFATRRVSLWRCQRSYFYCKVRRLRHQSKRWGDFDLVSASFFWTRAALSRKRTWACVQASVPRPISFDRTKFGVLLSSFAAGSKRCEHSTFSWLLSCSAQVPTVEGCFSHQHCTLLSGIESFNELHGPSATFVGHLWQSKKAALRKSGQCFDRLCTG